MILQLIYTSSFYLRSKEMLTTIAQKLLISTAPWKPTIFRRCIWSCPKILPVKFQTIFKHNTMTTINLEPFDIKFVQKSDHQQILELLRRFFYRDEPLNTYLKLLEGKESCPCLDKYCLKSLNDDNSFMAVTKSGKLIGVSVNKIKRRGITEEMDKIENPKFLKIATLLGYIDNESDIFGKYADIDTQLLVDILSVDPTYRGYGIAKQLMDKTREHAKKQGVQLMRVDCTSHFSARATAKLGFECIYSIKYKDYKVDGKPVLEPELPHTEAKIYVQRIDGIPLSKI